MWYLVGCSYMAKTLFRYLVDNGIEPKRAEQIATVETIMRNAETAGFLHHYTNEKGVQVYDRAEFEAFFKTLKRVT